MWMWMWMWTHPQQFRVGFTAGGEAVERGAQSPVGDVHVRRLGQGAEDVGEAVVQLGGGGDRRLLLGQHVQRRLPSQIVADVRVAAVGQQQLDHPLVQPRPRHRQVQRRFAAQRSRVRVAPVLAQHPATSANINFPLLRHVYATTASLPPRPDAPQPKRSWRGRGGAR